MSKKHRNFSIVILAILILLLLAIAKTSAQDAGIKWDGLAKEDPAVITLRRTVEHDYFQTLDKAHAPRPILLIVHCYTPEMSAYSTRVVIGTVQDEVWLAGIDHWQLERELSVMVYLRKRLQLPARKLQAQGGL